MVRTAFVAIVLSGCGSPESQIERSLRQAALAYPRPIEGRLSTAVHFAPWGKSSTASRHDPTPFSYGENKRVLRGSRPALAGRDPEDLHRTGLLALYHGDAARAVSALEVAAERRPSAAVLSDLAAAYLALAEDDCPWLRVDAIAAATRAVEKAPEEADAAFNLALALERMSLVHQSSLAWERYLTLENDSAWRQEASEHLARLREPTTGARWEAEKDRVVAAATAGDQATLTRLARQFPRQIKELLEGDLLSAWADAAGTPIEGSRLTTAKRVAEALASTGELLYIDVIGTIESRVNASQSLVEGHRAYAQGLALRGDCLQAVPKLKLARERLSAGGSPLMFAAQYQQLVCIYRSHPPEAEKSLGDLASKLERHPYPTLLAKTEAMRGLCAVADGRHSHAIAHYERAVQLLTGIGDNDVTRLRGMISEAYYLLGDRDTTWRYRAEALRDVLETGDWNVRHSILLALVYEMIGAGRYEVAQVVLSEMLADAHARSDSGAAAEALLRRIQLDLLSGSDDLATADIAECERFLKQYRQSADRERLETELMIASAERQLGTSSTKATEVILTVISRLEASADGLLLPRALLDLARARISTGDTEAAQKDFERALQIYEARREDTADERLRISFFSTTQAGFEAMIRFQALERGNVQAAFAYSERVRARALRDRMKARREVAAPVSLAEQLDLIPTNVAVLAYAVLPETLLVWRLYRGTLKMYELPAMRSDVVEVVASLRSMMMDESSDAGKTAATKAFDILLRPALEHLPTETELVFVPDRELYQLPFAALFDKARGHYLVEDHACLIAPSVESYLALQRNRPSTLRAPRRILAVGDPAFDRERFPTLSRLPYARKEALAVAILYRTPLLLVGEEASRQRILDGLLGSDVLHLAAHVVVDPRNPLDSFVATADPGIEPLRASDFRAKRLVDVELVFLAACDTAPGFTDGDREGVAGLARTFLAAGVPTVVATLWAVDDQAAARLAEVFHAQVLQGSSPAQALRSAQRALLSKPSSTPFAWSPFQLFQGS